MKTKRDQDVLNFIEDFRISTTSQLHRLFFPLTPIQYSSRRLKYLVDQGYVKRTRNTLTSGYAYFSGKKSEQMHHDLIRAELYLSLKEHYNIKEWNNETAVGSIRPDALTYIEDHEVIFPVLVEIHLNNKFDFDKYKNLMKLTDLKAMFGIMPRVIICTDRQVTVPNIGIKFKVIGLDMAGLDSLFK